MKRKPIIINPFGDSNSTILETLSIEYLFDSGNINFYTLTIDDIGINLDKIRLSEVMEKYKREILCAKLIEISIDTPLYDETYEFSKDVGLFLLTKKGIGYA